MNQTNYDVTKRILAAGDPVTATPDPNKKTTTKTATIEKKPIVPKKEESVEDEMKRFMGKACTANSDCGQSQFLVCNEVNKNKICEHKMLFPI